LSIVGTAGFGVWIDSSDTAGTSTIINTGTISGILGAIQGDDQKDKVFNTGTINGDVNLGNSNDQIDTRGGVINGAVTGSNGSDTYLISNADITLVESTGLAGDVDVVKSTVSYQLEANFETLQLLGAGDTRGTGTNLANTLLGNAGDNRLSGLDGADTMNGAAGDDVLRGGLGLDSMTGGDGDDVLRGGFASDTMQGSDGDDTVIGGAGGGRDAMYGATGVDTFLFETLGDTGKTRTLADVIGDFGVGTDIIDLGRLDAKTGSGGNDSFTFIGAGAFTSVAGQLHAVQADGATYVEYDVTGDGVADGVIKLTGLLTLTAADFIL
jgi:Ca2+-binding RTX toxin-like protein